MVNIFVNKFRDMRLELVNVEDQIKNSVKQEQFVFAMLRRSITDIKELLHNKGIYCGKNKLQFLAELQAIFKSQKSLPVYGQLNTGISTGNHPGAEVLEFRFIMNESIDMFDLPILSLGSKEQKNEIVIRFALELLGGDIVVIMVPKSFTSKEELWLSGSNYSKN